MLSPPPSRPGHRRRPGRPALPPADAGARPRGAGAGPGGRGAPGARSTASTPHDLEGSLDRLVAFDRGERQGAQRRLPRPRRAASGPTEVDDLARAGRAARPYVGRADPGDRARASVAARWPTSTCWRRTSASSGSAGRCTPWWPALPAPARAADGSAARACRSAVKDMVDVAGVTRGNGNPRAMAGGPATADAPVVAAAAGGRRRRLRHRRPARVRRRGAAPRAGGGAQPGRPDAHRRRVQRRLGRAGRRRRLPGRAGHRHRRLDPHPRRLLRLRRAQAQPRRGARSTGVHPLAPSLDHVGRAGRRRRHGGGGAGRGRRRRPRPRPGASALRLGLLRSQLDDPRVQPGVRAAVDGGAGAAGGGRGHPRRRRRRAPARAARGVRAVILLRGLGASTAPGPPPTPRGSARTPTGCCGPAPR